MIRYFPVLLLAGLLGELASIIVAGRWLGVLPVLILVVLGMLLGVRVIRAAGLSLAEALRQPKQVRVDAADRIMLAVAGLLLILPGFLSDSIAVLLLIPNARRWLGRRIAGGVRGTAASRADPFQGPVIEAEAVEIEGDIQQAPGRRSPDTIDRE